MDLNEAQRTSEEQFSRRSGNYGKSHILAGIGDVEDALKRIELPAGAEALDVATGAGHTAVCLAGKGFRVTASDLSRAMLDQTIALAKEKGVTLDTIRHPAECFPFSDGRFDLVTSRVAPHHFSDPGKFVGEAARVLRPGGYLLVIDGSVPDDRPVAAEWIHRIEKARDPSHGRFIPPGEWRAFCRDAGLEVLFCELQPMKMPGLSWYFEVAGTSPENRAKVLEWVDRAPEEARETFRLDREDDEIVWFWSRLTLIARGSS